MTLTPNTTMMAMTAAPRLPAAPRPEAARRPLPSSAMAVALPLPVDDSQALEAGIPVDTQEDILGDMAAATPVEIHLPEVETPPKPQRK